MSSAWRTVERPPRMLRAWGVSAVIVKGGETDQGGDALSRESSQFGEFGDEREGSFVSNAGDGLEELCTFFPCGIVVNELMNLVFDLPDLFLQELHREGETLTHGFLAHMFQPIGFGDAHGLELSSSSDLLLQLGRRGIPRLANL